MLVISFVFSDPTHLITHLLQSVSNFESFERFSHLVILVECGPVQSVLDQPAAVNPSCGPFLAAGRSAEEADRHVYSGWQRYGVSCRKENHTQGPGCKELHVSPRDSLVNDPNLQWASKYGHFGDLGRVLTRCPDFALGEIKCLSTFLEVLL